MCTSLAFQEQHAGNGIAAECPFDMPQIKDTLLQVCGRQVVPPERLHVSS